MNGMLVFSCIFIACGTIVLLVGLGDSRLTTGHDLSKSVKVVCCIIGSVFVLLGISGFIFGFRKMVLYTVDSLKIT